MERLHTSTKNKISIQQPVVCLLMLLTIIGCKNQRSIESSNSPPKDDVKVSDYTDAFYMNVSSLPAQFKGHDPNGFYENASLSRNEFEKDDFETSEQFKQRINAASLRPILANLNYNDYFTFRAKPSMNTTYDADKEEFMLRFDTIMCIYRLEKYDTGNYPSRCDVEVLELSYTEAEPEYYEGSNAFGAKALVTKISKTITGLIICLKLTQHEELLRLDHPGVSLSMPPDKARQVKDDLSLLLILKPEIPYTEYATK